MIALDKLADLRTPEPTQTAVSAPFWAALSQGRFALQRCDACDEWVFYPRAICSHCWSPMLRWQQASGRSRLLTWSVQRRAGHPGWQAVAPYALGLVRLDEGPTMLTTLLVPDEQLALDLPLRLRIVAVGSTALPFFEPRP